MIYSYELVRCEDVEVLIIAIGISARSVHRVVDACRTDGKKVGLFRPVILWSFQDIALRSDQKAKIIMALELNIGHLSVGDRASGP